ncbi:MAG: hypothetical protein QM692_08410 [Thermomicrobiales bacterium]
MGEKNQQSRRAVLRLAAGAVTLLAGGLVLADAPAAEAETTGALGGKRGRYRSKQRRERKQRREERRRSRNRDSKGAPKGKAQLLNVALFIHNQRAAAVSVRLWRMDAPNEIIYWKAATDWQPIAAKPATGPDHFIDYVEDSRRFAVAINDNHVIEVNNPSIGYPHATLGVGGWTTDGWSPQGQTLINMGFAEWETASAAGFTLQRLSDTATHKRFLLTLV